tara:strand:+ start:962 stop:1066 length:105 start_codon:yes stop_codon:yes gene_type:complete
MDTSFGLGLLLTSVSAESLSIWLGILIDLTDLIV